MITLGIDEVGRGPWAGPLVVGAVVLKSRQPKLNRKTGRPVSTEVHGLADSKVLSNARRRDLKRSIKNKAACTGLGWVSASELDEIGQSAALRLATVRAVCKALKCQDLDHLPAELPFDEIIIDGTQNFLEDTPLEDLVSVLTKADGCIKEVSAASIIAKVARDDYMISISHRYSDYGFERNVGYGTAEHKATLEEFGPCPEHRFSVKPVMKVARARGMLGSSRAKARAKSSSPTTTALGRRAEDVVADYLVTHEGHKIIARNYRTKFYEIDIVSATHDHIYFTEVKYRKTKSHGTPLEFIGYSKERQISFAADAFMQFLSRRLEREIFSLPSPVLAAASVTGEDFELEKWITLD